MRSTLLLLLIASAIAETSSSIEPTSTQAKAGKLLFVLTSHQWMLDGKEPAGYYLAEAAHPYYTLRDHFDIEWASPKGGQAPLNPDSVEMCKEELECQKFLKDEVISRYGSWFDVSRRLCMPSTIQSGYLLFQRRTMKVIATA